MVLSFNEDILAFEDAESNIILYDIYLKEIIAQSNQLEQFERDQFEYDDHIKHFTCFTLAKDHLICSLDSKETVEIVPLPYLGFNSYSSNYLSTIFDFHKGLFIDISGGETPY